MFLAPLDATAGSVVSPEGRVILVGENAAGIRSFAARLEEQQKALEAERALLHQAEERRAWGG